MGKKEAMQMFELHLRSWFETNHVTRISRFIRTGKTFSIAFHRLFLILEQWPICQAKLTIPALPEWRVHLVPLLSERLCETRLTSGWYSMTTTKHLRASNFGASNLTDGT